MSDKQELRRFERVEVSLPARLSVLIPEQTFRPVELDCEILDISERGAMINVRLESKDYSLMLQKTRYCRLNFAGAIDLPARVTGRAVWLQPQGKDENRTYKIGLFFEDCPEEIVTILRNYVESLKKNV